jgi:hypothetical protein
VRIYNIMSTAKEIMKNLFKLTANKSLPLECFILYWFYWSSVGKVLTQDDAAKVIGRNDDKTARKYNKLLDDAGFVRFEIVRKQGIVGFKATPLKIGDSAARKLKLKHKISKKKLPIKKVKSKYLILAKLLYTEHKAYDENFLAGQDLTKVFTRWADSIRLLVEKDKREVSTVEKIIKWCQSPGNFWIPNILSGKTLRDKFATLYSQYMRDAGKYKNVIKHKKIKDKKFKGSDVKGLLNDL